MQTALLLLASVTLIAWVVFLVDAVRGFRFLTFVRALRRPGEDAVLPPLSVVVPARNEAATIEPALRSLMALEYPALEILVIDDRSDDGTGRIVERVAAADPRVRVLRIEELPHGWLGKNHALQEGAEAATGELILFTDADVVFRSDLVVRVVAYMNGARLDHVTMAPDVVVRSLGLELFVATFALLFNAWFRPWKAADPRSRHGVGFGAFNLVRATTYRAAGGHAALAAVPIDDVALGQLLKDSGARQRCAVAGDALVVEWYPSLRAAIRGLEKNTLAAVGWSLPLLVAGGITQVATIAWPFAALLLTRGPVAWLNGAIVAVIVLVQAGLLRETSLRAWTIPALPLGVLLVQFTAMRAAALTLWRGGIEWRGTFYRLRDLR